MAHDVDADETVMDVVVGLHEGDALALRQLAADLHAVAGVASAEVVAQGPADWRMTTRGRSRRSGDSRKDAPWTAGCFRLRGLAPKARYEILDADTRRTHRTTGDGLMATGLEVRLREPNTSALLFYQRV
jgi:hypothetical protein